MQESYVVGLFRIHNIYLKGQDVLVMKMKLHYMSISGERLKRLRKDIRKMR